MRGPKNLKSMAEEKNVGRQARELKALEVQRLTQAGRHSVGVVPGLCLQVKTPTASDARSCRTWILRVTVGGRRRDIGLGGYPAVTLAQAHQKARETRALIENGEDPVTRKREAKSALRADSVGAVTFERAANDYVTTHQATWRNAKHAAQWRSTLANYAFPTIGQFLVRDVAREHVLAVLQPIWATKTETASRLRGRIEQVLSYAMQAGYRVEGLNPARWRGNLDKVLGDPSRIAKIVHHRALRVDGMPSFMQQLSDVGGVGARALEFAILTAARSGEVRGATWSEIDLKTAVWTIPARRMKAGKEHRVPLASSAMRVLNECPAGSAVDPIFCSPAGKQLSDMTLTAVTRRMGVDAVPHGFRSTFRDWAADQTNIPNEVCEAALAHAVADKVEAAYRRGDLFEKRRLLMTQWNDFVSAKR
jgi:integrase